MATDIELPVASLLLDARNPRHRVVEGQADAIAALLGRRPGKVLNLAKHIATHGLNPLDRILVLKDDAGYVVLEGNRRVAAIKLLDRPKLIQNTKLQIAFTEAKKSGTVPTQVLCSVVESRDEAAEWLLLRHGGELEGAGTARWSTGMRIRFGAKPNTQEYKAIALLDWILEKADAGANESLAALAETVFDDKPTTFGRLVGDPLFREYCGFELDDRNVTLLDEDKAVLRRLTRVLKDLTGNLTVTDLKRKDQRATYVAGLAEALGERVSPEAPGSEVGAGVDLAPDSDSPNDGGDTSSVAAGGNAGVSTPTSGNANTSNQATVTPSQGGQQRPAAQRNQAARPSRLFGGLKLSNCPPRIRDVLREVQRLEVSLFPNSAAALTRMVIELVVTEAMAIPGWNAPHKDDLKTRILTCLVELDPSGKDKKYKDIRNQVGVLDSIISANTLNAFLHNVNYFPSATELRAISDKYVGFLGDLDAEIGKA